MLHLTLIELMAICGSVFLLALLIIGHITLWMIDSEFQALELNTSALENYRSAPRFIYSYNYHNGPHMWKFWFPKIGCNQSPINIKTDSTVVVQPSKSLKWNGYHTTPLSIVMSNHGNTVQLLPTWNNNIKPYIQGGPLLHSYEFYSIKFHWGSSDIEGSEHTLDDARFPMEMQAIHVKQDLKSADYAIKNGIKDGILIISFFFHIANTNNTNLDNIIHNLYNIQQSQSKVDIPSFPLEKILPCFEKSYYTYNGSLSQSPCNEIVTWIIQPKPIPISSSQVKQFRKLRSKYGPIISNCRPMQSLNDREIYFYD